MMGINVTRIAHLKQAFIIHDSIKYIIGVE